MKEVIVRLTSDRIKIKGGEYVQDLVRCVECKYCTAGVIAERRKDGYERDVNICRRHSEDMLVPSDHFCSYGEVRDE